MTEKEIVDRIYYQFDDKWDAIAEGIKQGRKQLEDEILTIIHSHGSGQIVKGIVYDEIKEKLQKEMKQ